MDIQRSACRAASGQLPIVRSGRPLRSATKTHCWCLRGLRRTPHAEPLRANLPKLSKRKESQGITCSKPFWMFCYKAFQMRYQILPMCAHVGHAATLMQNSRSHPELLVAADTSRTLMAGSQWMPGLQRGCWKRKGRRGPRLQDSVPDAQIVLDADALDLVTQYSSSLNIYDTAYLPYPRRTTDLEEKLRLRFALNAKIAIADQKVRDGRPMSASVESLSVDAWEDCLCSLASSVPAFFSPYLPCHICEDMLDKHRAQAAAAGLGIRPRWLESPQQLVLDEEELPDPPEEVPPVDTPYTPSVALFLTVRGAREGVLQAHQAARNTYVCTAASHSLTQRCRAAPLMVTSFSGASQRYGPFFPGSRSSATGIQNCTLAKALLKCCVLLF